LFAWLEEEADDELMVADELVVDDEFEVEFEVAESATEA
jgi:hypothetical protein